MRIPQYYCKPIDPTWFDPNRRLIAAITIRAIRDYIEPTDSLTDEEYSDAVRYLYSPFCGEFLTLVTGRPARQIRRTLAALKEKENPKCQ